MSDQLTLLRSSTPERLIRFAEHWHATLDIAAAAAHIGASPREARSLVQDRRVLLYFAALSGATRDVADDVRRATIAWIAQAMVVDPAGMFDEQGLVRMRLSDVPPEVRAVMQVEIKSDGSWKATLPSKLKVAELLLTLTGDLAPTGAGAVSARVVFHGRDPR